MPTIWMANPTVANLVPKKPAENTVLPREGEQCMMKIFHGFFVFAHHPKQFTMFSERPVII